MSDGGLQFGLAGLQRGLGGLKPRDLGSHVGAATARLGQVDQVLHLGLEAAKPLLVGAPLGRQRRGPVLRAAIDLADGLIEEGAVPTDGGQLLDHGLFELSGRHTLEGAGDREPVLLRQALVVEVVLAVLRPDVADHRPTAMPAPDQPAQEEAVLVGGGVEHLTRLPLVVLVHELLRLLEIRGRDQRLVLARELLARALVGDEADVDLAPEDADHAVDVKGLAAVEAAVEGLVRLPPQPQAVELLGHAQNRGPFQVELEDSPHDGGLGLVDHELLVLEVVAQRRDAAAPQALARPGEMEVLGALLVELAVVLGELDHDGGHQPPLRALGVDGLRGRDEGHVVLLEELEELVKIARVPGHAV